MPDKVSYPLHWQHLVDRQIPQAEFVLVPEFYDPILAPVLK
jgi:hypothetical protein